jgi:hypothetical protein
MNRTRSRAVSYRFLPMQWSHFLFRSLVPSFDPSNLSSISSVWSCGKKEGRRSLALSLSLSLSLSLFLSLFADFYSLGSSQYYAASRSHQYANWFQSPQRRHGITYSDMLKHGRTWRHVHFLFLHIVTAYMHAPRYISKETGKHMLRNTPLSLLFQAFLSYARLSEPRIIVRSESEFRGGGGYGGFWPKKMPPPIPFRLKPY